MRHTFTISGHCTLKKRDLRLGGGKVEGVTWGWRCLRARLVRHFGFPAKYSRRRGRNDYAMSGINLFLRAYAENVAVCANNIWLVNGSKWWHFQTVQKKKNKKSHFLPPHVHSSETIYWAGEKYWQCVSRFLINHIRSQGHVNQLNHVIDIIIERVIKKKKSKKKKQRAVYGDNGTL